MGAGFATGSGEAVVRSDTDMVMRIVEKKLYFMMMVLEI
jgi:hypothetical protein